MNPKIARRGIQEKPNVIQNCNQLVCHNWFVAVSLCRKLLSLSPTEIATPRIPTNIRHIFEFTYRYRPHNGEVNVGSDCPRFEAISVGRFVEKQST